MQERRMKRRMDWLKEILADGYTDEIGNRVADEIGKAYVSKSDYDTAVQTATEWQAKAAQVEQEAQAKVEAIRFDATLDAAITKAGGRNAKAVRAVLDMDALRQSKDAEGDIASALDACAKEHEYLFRAANPPVYAAGTGSTPPARDDGNMALRAAFGLSKK